MGGDRKVYITNDGTLYLVFDDGDGGIYEINDVTLSFDEAPVVPEDATQIA